MSAHTQHFTVRDLKAPSNVSNWPQTWKFSLFLLHMTVFKNSTVQIFTPTILQLMSKLCSLCLILDGPLEKWLGEGEGGWGWDFVSLQDFFYMSTTLAKSFFWGGGGDQGHCTMFFGGVGRIDILLLLSLSSITTIWLPGTGLKQILFFYLPHSHFAKQLIQKTIRQCYFNGSYCPTDGIALHFLFHV